MTRYWCDTHKYRVIFYNGSIMQMISETYILNVRSLGTVFILRYGDDIMPPLPTLLNLPFLPESWTPENMEDKIKLLLSYS